MRYLHEYTNMCCCVRSDAGGAKRERERERERREEVYNSIKRK